MSIISKDRRTKNVVYQSVVEDFSRRHRFSVINASCQSSFNYFLYYLSYPIVHGHSVDIWQMERIKRRWRAEKIELFYVELAKVLV